MLMAVMMMMIKRSFILRLDQQRSVDFQLLGPSRHFSKIYNLFESVEQNSLALIEALVVSLQYYNFCHFYFVFVVFFVCFFFNCRPYIIDLESANGTFLNNQKIEPRRFYELKEKVTALFTRGRRNKLQTSFDK